MSAGTDRRACRESNRAGYAAVEEPDPDARSELPTSQDADAAHALPGRPPVQGRTRVLAPRTPGTAGTGHVRPFPADAHIRRVGDLAVRTGDADDLTGAGGALR